MSEKKSPRKVLIVDDDEVFRQILAIGLGAAGFETLAAENGVKAMQVIPDFKPDVLVIDMLMPVMDGLELLRWVKDKAKLTLPSIVVTSLDAQVDVVDCLAAGASDVVTKPFSLDVLLGKISKLV